MAAVYITGRKSSLFSMKCK